MKRIRVYLTRREVDILVAALSQVQSRQETEPEVVFHNLADYSDHLREDVSSNELEDVRYNLLAAKHGE